MKAIFIVVAIVTFNLSSFSQTTAYQQLVSVNSKWLQVTDFDKTLETLPAKTLNEQQLIQFHLQQTEKLLRNRNVNNFTARQKRKRAKLLNILHSYCVAGKFPINTLHQNRQPYFIDDFNTYCAVGYLMQQSGADAIAKEINATQNYNYLEDIHHPQLMQWVQQSGFSVEELALIQPGYGGEYPFKITEIHYNNIGTDVNEYIEILDGHFFLDYLTFDSVYFYNTTNVIYKKLIKTQFSSTPSSIRKIYYYQFAGSSDTLADEGKIELISYHSLSQYFKKYDLRYTSDSIITNYYDYKDSAILTSRSSVAENNSTAVGTSVNFCGSASFNAVFPPSVLPTTIGTLNNCVQVPVPITLGDFNSTIKENKIVLDWQTLTETNNNFFEIEHSTDGKKFNAIGNVAAKKTSGVNNYSFIDEKPHYLNHYRLKQIDNDGKFSYSKILFVKMANANPLTIINAPAKSVLQVNIALDNSKLDALELYDLYGRKLKEYKAIQGNQQLNIKQLVSGKYILLLKTTIGEVYQQQVLIVQ
ncbi:MAG: hypothetical protein NTZ59_02825 [Bacteroidetes bacterium]|nr:hypothetical protein [Bacteroidota bacterium]